MAAALVSRHSKGPSGRPGGAKSSTEKEDRKYLFRSRRLLPTPYYGFKTFAPEGLPIWLTAHRLCMYATASSAAGFMGCGAEPHLKALLKFAGICEDGSVTDTKPPPGWIKPDRYSPDPDPIKSGHREEDAILTGMCEKTGIKMVPAYMVMHESEQHRLMVTPDGWVLDPYTGERVASVQIKRRAACNPAGIKPKNTEITQTALEQMVTGMRFAIFGIAYIDTARFVADGFLDMSPGTTARHILNIFVYELPGFFARRVHDTFKLYQSMAIQLRTGVLTVGEAEAAIAKNNALCCVHAPDVHYYRLKEGQPPMVKWSPHGHGHGYGSLDEMPYSYANYDTTVRRYSARIDFRRFSLMRRALKTGTGTGNAGADTRARRDARVRRTERRFARMTSGFDSCPQSLVVRTQLIIDNDSAYRGRRVFCNVNSLQEASLHGAERNGTARWLSVDNSIYKSTETLFTTPQRFLAASRKRA